MSTPELIGLLFTLAMLSLAIWISFHRRFQMLAFTIWILTGVLLGLTFPSWFIGFGEFKFTQLFVPILQVIMFGMGTTLSVSDFTRVFRRPVAVLIGLSCQFTIMPILGLGLATLAGFPAEIAAGLVLVGVSPSGLASNVMCYLARADVALSVSMTAMATLLAPLATPTLMKWLIGQSIELDVIEMMFSITKIVVLPVLVGLIFHHTLYQRFRWMDRVMPIVSMAGIFALTVLTVAPGRDNLIQLGFLLIVVCVVHCWTGFLLGYWACRLLGMSPLACRTISLEVGLQNAGMASGIAAELNKVATLGLAPMVFGPVMNLSGSILANWWRSHFPQEDQGIESITDSSIEN